MTESREGAPKLARRLSLARAETDRLFTHVDRSAIYDRPIAERHRMIFYLGHLEAFDWNLMQLAGMSGSSPNTGFDHLFAFGIDPEPGQLPSDTPLDWPSLEEVAGYNQGVRERIDSFLQHAPEEEVQMMIEHRHMHAETFAYILHSLDSEKKTGLSDELVHAPQPAPKMIEVSAGAATLGRDGGEFGWDNEFCAVTEQVSAFEMSKFKVSNGEYLDYMRQTGAAAPYYWFQQNGEWFLRGMFQNRRLSLNWPAYVTFEQASQYARFRKMALPTESQYHRAAYGSPGYESERLLPWKNGQAAPSPAQAARHGNFGYAAWDPIPVNASPLTESAWGIAQLVGNGWEWTSTVFAPFPGFAPRATYPGYSANFFDGSHYVLKGASPRTSDTLVRRTLRNWFRPEYPYVYATFHLVQN